MTYQCIFDFFLFVEKKRFELSLLNGFAHQDLLLFVEICGATKVCYRRENECLFKDTLSQSLLHCILYK